MNANMKEIENKIEQEKIKLKSNTPSKKEKCLHQYLIIILDVINF